MSWIDIGALRSELIIYALGFFSIPLKNLIQGGLNRLLHDLPFVHGKYKSRYQFRRKGGETVEAEETIRVKKFGRWIWATAEMTKPITKKWKIRGELRGLYLFATVEAATRKTLSGKGFVLLKSLTNGAELVGQMMWVDSKLEAVYSTPYVWERVDKEEQE